MSNRIVFSVIESPTHPRLSGLYQELGLQELQFKSIRKTIAALKQHRPDFIVAEFFYAYSTNYSSNHISNLDSLLITLQKYPDYNPQLILLVKKNERQYVARLEAHYKVDHVLTHPVDPDGVKTILLKHKSV
jgi:hypothetical protein